jgi:hypothetical protein
MWVRLITEEETQGLAENDRVDHHIMMSGSPELSEIKNKNT